MNVPVEDELRKLSWENYERERKLKAEREDLIRCRTELADPRLSGDKKLDDIPELDLAADTTKVQEKLGITESGRIKVIRKENLKDRLEKESRYRDSLQNLLAVLTRHQESCNRELGYKRVQHGLPAQRYPALGYYGPHGNFIVTRQAEKNLDDAFQILALQTQAGKKLERAEAAEAAKLAAPVPEEVVEETPLPTGT